MHPIINLKYHHQTKEQLYTQAAHRGKYHNFLKQSPRFHKKQPRMQLPLSANAAAIETERARSVPTCPSRAFVLQRAFKKYGLTPERKKKKQRSVMKASAVKVSIDVNETSGHTKGRKQSFYLRRYLNFPPVSQETLHCIHLSACRRPSLMQHSDEHLKIKTGVTV